MQMSCCSCISSVAVALNYLYSRKQVWVDAGCGTLLF